MIFKESAEEVLNHFFRSFRRDYLGLILVHVLSSNDPSQAFSAEIVVAVLNDLVQVSLPHSTGNLSMRLEFPKYFGERSILSHLNIVDCASQH